jgi:hypothetical protein
MGDGAEKEVTFLTTFLKRKTVFGAFMGIFSLFEALKKGGKKPSKHAYIRQRLSMKHFLVSVSKDCSNKSHWVQTGPVPGVSLFLYYMCKEKTLKNLLLKNSTT